MRQSRVCGFKDSDDGQREAATFARDMEKTGFGREGWHGGRSELLVDLDGSKILYVCIPSEQVTTAPIDLSRDWHVRSARQFLLTGLLRFWPVLRP
jgi:hypothetical protein